MVFRSTTLLARARGGDRYWKKRRIFALSAHFFGRKKNIYSFALRYVRRALRYSTLARKAKKHDTRALWDLRLNASCEELSTKYEGMKDVLNEAGVALDRKTLQNLAVWEPRSFRALALLTKARQEEMGLHSLEGPATRGVITRCML